LIKSLLLWSVILASMGRAEANPGDIDSQLWGEVDVRGVVGGVDLTALGVMRQSASLPDPTLIGGGLIVGTGLGGSWSVEAGDLWVRAKTAAGAAIDVDVPLVAAIYRWSLGDVTMGERLRFEQLTGIPGEPWRYRNRLDAAYPIDLGLVRGIVASDEIFYDFGQSAWSRNRAQLGVEVASGGPTMLTIGYLRQDDRLADPTGINAVCATLVINVPYSVESPCD
jgi:hypothetical protein